jgi:hypothetical protein
MIGGYTYRHSLMGGIYEVRCLYGLRCHDIHTKFHKDLFSHSTVDEGIRKHTERMVIAQACFYFLNKESMLKMMLMKEKKLNE